VLPPGKENEALDTMVYALAARQATKIRLDLLPAASRPPEPPQPLPEGAIADPPDMPPPMIHRLRRSRVIVRSRWISGA
jgi:phage terminase large subunit GpA-like protein